jgi:hypothetical protein
MQGENISNDSVNLERLKVAAFFAVISAICVFGFFISRMYSSVNININIWATGYGIRVIGLVLFSILILIRTNARLLVIPVFLICSVYLFYCAIVIINGNDFNNTFYFGDIVPYIIAILTFIIFILYIYNIIKSKIPSIIVIGSSFFIYIISSVVVRHTSIFLSLANILFSIALLLVIFNIDTKKLLNKSVNIGISELISIVKKNLTWKNVIYYVIKGLLFIALFYNLFFIAVHIYDNHLMRTSNNSEDVVMALSTVSILFFLPISLIVDCVIIKLLKRFRFSVSVILLIINAIVLPYITYLIIIPSK